MKCSAAVLIAALAGLVVARPSNDAERIKIREEDNSRSVGRAEPFAKKSSTNTLLDGVANSAIQASRVYWGHAWAGAVMNTPPSGHYRSVTGSFIVPNPQPIGHPRVKDKQWAAITVGIDGVCNGGMVLAGIEFRYTLTGFFFNAWWEAWPYGMTTVDIATFPVMPGDNIQVEIIAPTTITATVKITNHSRGRVFSQDIVIQRKNALCRENALFIVQDIMSYGQYTTLANFGTVNFFGISTRLSNGHFRDLTSPFTRWEIAVGPDDAPKCLTNTEIKDGKRLTISYAPQK
ncbi:hypothetical protein ACEQ8H_002679 [Pleosporales sp. CAS-2024a]